MALRREAGVWGVLLLAATVVAVQTGESGSVASIDSLALSPPQLGSVQLGETAGLHNPMAVDADGIPNHYVPVDEAKVREHVVSPRPHETINMLDLPDQFDWRNVDGKSYVSIPRNQHIPAYCGACWAFATLSTLNDRIKIARKDEWPEIVLSPQHMLSCSDAGSCLGGNHLMAFQWLKESQGVTDETCAPYQAKDFTTPLKMGGRLQHVKHCTAERTCKDCKHSGGCFPVRDPTKYSIGEWGRVAGEDQMKAEIKERGPIACGIAVTDSFMQHYKGGVFEDMTGERKIRHVVSLLGWGTAEDGTPFWIGRNSWGTYWGESGFFKIVRGKNNLRIEDECGWAVPTRSWPSKSQMLGTGDVVEKGRLGSTEHFLHPKPLNSEARMAAERAAEQEIANEEEGSDKVERLGDVGDVPGTAGDSGGWMNGLPPSHASA